MEKGLSIKGFIIYLILGVFFCLMAGGIFFLILKVNQAIYSEEIEKKIEIALEIAKENLDSEIQTALSLAIVIADRERIKEGFIKDDRELLYKEITEQIARLKKGADYKELDIHLHTKDLRVYVRSWDFNSFGIELSPFSKGLVKVKETLQPLASIELGQRMNIKAISPVMQEGEYLGSAEVHFGFDRVSRRLSQKGINFFILMEGRHLGVATRMIADPRIDGFVLANSSCEQTCIEKLRGKLTPSVLKKGYIETDDFVFGFSPFFSFDGEKLGYIGVFFDRKLINEPSILYAFERLKEERREEKRLYRPMQPSENPPKGITIQ